jgi:hypothetical protein
VQIKLENAADRASELQANIAQPKRIGTWHSTRQVHYPGALTGRFVGRFYGVQASLPE